MISLRVGDLCELTGNCCFRDFDSTDHVPNEPDLEKAVIAVFIGQCFSPGSSCVSMFCFISGVTTFWIVAAPKLPLDERVHIITRAHLELPLMHSSTITC